MSVVNNCQIHTHRERNQISLCPSMIMMILEKKFFLLNSMNGIAINFFVSFIELYSYSSSKQTPFDKLFFFCFWIIRSIRFRSYSYTHSDQFLNSSHAVSSLMMITNDNDAQQMKCNETYIKKKAKKKKTIHIDIVSISIIKILFSCCCCCSLEL